MIIGAVTSRRIPAKLINWIDNFCSERTANITVNEYSSELSPLPQAGLPQGTPLSPILFLFFNATLIQQVINAKGGSLAFVNDYTAWVVGDSAEANTDRPLLIQDEWIKPKDKVKILGVTLDDGLRPEQHIVNATNQGMQAVLALKRLKNLPPSVTCQLFISTVCPSLDMLRLYGQVKSPLNCSHY